MNGFPYALLYRDCKYDKVRLKFLADTITKAKLRKLHPCLQSDHINTSASNGLMFRAARLQYGLTCPDQFLRLELIKRATYCVSVGDGILSVRARAHLAALTLDATLEELVYTTLTAKEVRTLHDHNTLTIGKKNKTTTRTGSRTQRRSYD